ncbi:hypothetical protein CPC08DRAFT_708555 [Agrocybe pediades]|nr:hypothetical protein CPC08DRAFT_708555 [Agrocybe pediades]
MFSKAFVALTFASAAFATVFVTNPVESTTLAAGQAANINWQDDGVAPSLKDFGPAIISIYVGNARNQTRLQTIQENVDVSQVNSIVVTPDATIGPNSNEYFIRFESVSLKDAAQPQFPALAFSHKFSLSGMTGTFSDEVKAQIADKSAAAPLTSAASSKASSTAASSTSSNKPTGSQSAAAANKTEESSGVSVRAGWAGAVLAAVVGASLF